MKRNIILILVAVIALLGVVGYAIPSLSATSASAAVAQSSAATLPPAVSSAPALGTASDLQSTFENVYAQVNPSVVLIQVVQQATTNSGGPNTPGFGFFGQQQQPQTQQALGSGFVWNTQGDIVTNNHVIAGATQISVTFADGTTVPGQVVGADPASDLAVVKVNVNASELHPVQMATTPVRVGQIAIAIGNPFGEQNTMTTGIISALGRTLPADNQSSTGPSYTIPDVIQTDAPINPGNSGGVLLNADGQVVGVTSAIESSTNSSSGIGFAIPGEIVQKVVPALISTGHVDHPYLGISGTDLTPSLAQAMGLQSSQRGALVVSVTPGSPAANAGLQGGSQQVTVDGQQAVVGGDVIVAINGQPVKTFDDLVAYLATSTQVNQTVSLTILRSGSQQTVKVVLAARPSSQTSQ